MNPGPWGAHSRTVAHCARCIAKQTGMDADKAYIVGLLHDIGRRFGKRHLGHVIDGYRYIFYIYILTINLIYKKIKGYLISD
ncbi:MAG: HDOD domain-containing protein [Lachnospiraceae bacterium]|nr:HDOD domain-containing protein [Lachnospiraceae bacterium]